MMQSRRAALKSAGAMAMLLSLGIASAQEVRAAGRAGFEAKTLADAIRALGGNPAANAQVLLTSPDVEENGGMVPVGVVSRVPSTTHVFLLVEHNPMPLVAAFAFPAGTEPEIQTHIRMAQSSHVVAVVRAGGRLHMARKETRVTLGGCGA